MADFLQTLTTAIAIGSLYALISLGYTMVYGILKFINFAHSDIVVLGSWLSYTFAQRLIVAAGYADAVVPPLWIGALVLILVMLSCGAVGFMIERLAYRPLRRAPRLNVLITAIGVSLLLQNVGQLKDVFGASPQTMPNLIANSEVVHFAFGEGNAVERVVIRRVELVILGTSLLLLLGLELLVFRTKLGTAMRAVSFNADTAALMGVPVDRVISITFVLGSMLAAAAGFLYVLKYGTFSQPASTVWVLLGLKAFVAAVIGGIGNIRGAVAGGFVIAFVEQFGAFYISSNYRDVYVFSLLILILLVKPTGIFGSTIREKV